MATVMLVVMAMLMLCFTGAAVNYLSILDERTSEVHTLIGAMLVNKGEIDICGHPKPFLCRIGAGPIASLPGVDKSRLLRWTHHPSPPITPPQRVSDSSCFS